MELLQLLDKNKNIIAILKNYKDLCIESILETGDKTISFSYSPKELFYDLIEEEGYIKNKTQEYVIKSKDISGDYTLFKCALNLEELEGLIHPRFESVEQTITSALNLAIVSTGWTVKENNIKKKRTVRCTNKSALDIVKEIKKKYRVDIVFNTLNKQIEIFEHLGSDKGTYFTDQLNMSALQVQSDSFKYATRIIAEGKNGLTFEDINGGKNYVENYQYSNKVKTIYWKDERYTIKENLLADAKAKLEELSKPFRAYHASVLNLADLNPKYKNILDYKLGDTITLISRNNKVRDKQRIVKTIEYPDNHEKDTVDLANATLSFADIQQENEETTDTVNNITTDNGTLDSNAIEDNSIEIKKIDNFEANVLKVTKLDVINANIENLHANKADIQDLNAVKATVGQLEATKANITQLNATNAEISKLNTIKANITELNAANSKINVLESKTASIDNLLAGNLTANNFKANSITANSGIIAEGAIGSGQISSLTANKINAGTIDLSLVTVAGPNGRLKILGNKLQIFDDVNNKLFERIMLGVENNRATLTLRGADGQTILLSENGLTKAGITDGFNKADDNSLNASKFDKNSIVRQVNGATETIAGTRIQVGDRTLDVELSTQKNTITEHSKELSSQKATIQALDNAIKLKVDTQTFTQSTTVINNNINKAKEDAINTANSNTTNAINGMKIGIENLIDNGDLSFDMYKFQYADGFVNYDGEKCLYQTVNTNNESFIATSKYDFSNLAGKKITISFFGAKTTNVSSVECFVLITKKGSTKDWDYCPNKRFNLTEKLQYFEWTLELPTDSEKCYIRFDNNGSTNGANATIYITKIKVVEGTIKSAWSPSSNDLKKYSDDVAKAKADLAQANAIASADGKITAEEQKRIQQAQENLNTAIARADKAKSDAKAYSDTLGQQLKANAEKYANDVAIAKSELAKQQAIANADGKINAEEQKRIAEAKKNLDTAIAKASEAETKAKSYADTKKQEAINVAENLALEKSNLAKKYAEDVATAKANLAKTEAIASADGKIDVEEKARIKQAQDNLNTAIAKADKAKQDAITEANRVAELKKNEAINSANSHADGKANEALNNAKAYINTEITTVNTHLNKATSEINILKGQIESKVSQTDVDNTVIKYKTQNYGYLYKKDIIIHGDYNFYYPVIIKRGNQDVKRKIFINRSFNEQAPSEWNPDLATHHGGLSLLISANFGGWGGANYSWNIYDLEEQYSRMFAGAVNCASNMAFAIFLRGGGEKGAVYHLYSDQPLDGELPLKEGMPKPSVPQIAYNKEMIGFYEPAYEFYAPAPRTITKEVEEEIKKRKFIELSQSNATEIIETNKKISTVESSLTQENNSIKASVKDLNSTTQTITTNVSNINRDLTNKINSNLDAAKSFATDIAIAKANLAQANAIANADGKITEEERKRIQQAESNLNTAIARADKAKQDAINAASSDATNKANSAKQQAILGARTIPDTRNDNQSPGWYMEHYPNQLINEFKNANVIGITGTTYGILETKVPWADSSGGFPVQTFRSNNTPTYQRQGLKSTNWSEWKQIEDTQGSQAKANDALNNAKTYVNAEINTVNSKVHNVESNLNILSDKINSKVSQSDIDKSIQEIKIGGRNLIINSDTLQNLFSPLSGYVGTREVINDEYALCKKDVVFKCTHAGTGFHLPLFTKNSNRIGKTYTWSFWAKCSVNKSGTIGHESNGQTQVNFTTEWKKFSHTWLFGDCTYSSFTFYIGWNVGEVLYIRDFKIEEGTKATDWTPAPEDVDALVVDSIKKVDSKISNVSSELTQTKNSIAASINSINSKTQSIETNLNGKATKQEVTDVNNKVSTIKANLDSITQRVSTTESKTHTLENNLNSKANKQEVTDISNKVTNIEANVNGITQRVSSSESRINSLNGQVQNATTKQEFTEFKQSSQNAILDIQNTSGNNYVSNPIFNTGDLKGWEVWGNGTSWAVKEDTSLSHAYSLKLQCFKRSQGVTQTIPGLVYGKKYTLKVKMKVEQGTPGIMIRNDNQWGGVSFNPNQGYGKWVEVKMQFWAREGTTPIYVGNVSTDSVSTFWVSEIMLHEGYGEIPFSDNAKELYSARFQADLEGFMCKFSSGAYNKMGERGNMWYAPGMEYPYRALSYHEAVSINTDGSNNYIYRDVQLPARFDYVEPEFIDITSSLKGWYKYTGKVFNIENITVSTGKVYRANGHTYAQIACRGCIRHADTFGTEGLQVVATLHVTA